MANKPDDEYDPHAERVVLLKHPINDIETLCHMLNAVLGTGILAMPEAFMFVGLIEGLIGTALIGLVLSHSVHQLIKAEYEICKRKRIPSLTYGVAMKTALEIGPLWARRFSQAMLYLTDSLLVLNQGGTCCAYLIFVARNTKYVCDQWLDENVAIELYLLGTSIFSMLMIMIRNLKYMAPISMAATFLQLILFAIVGYYVFTDLPTLGENTVYFVGPMKVPLFIGTAVFAMMAMGVFVSAEHNMKTPKSFHKIFNVSMVFTTVIYGLVGFCGYWRYEDRTESSITLNLPKADIPVQITIIGICLIIITGYGVHGYAGFEIIWFGYKKKLLKDIRYMTGWEYLTRFEFFFGTFIFGIIIPLLGLVISLCGCVCISCLGVVFPAVMELCVLYPNYGKFHWGIVKNAIMIFIGIFAFFSGTYCCVYEITMKMLSGEELKSMMY